MKYCREEIAAVLSHVDLRSSYPRTIYDRELKRARAAGGWTRDLLERQIYLYRLGWKECMAKVCAELQIGYPSGFCLVDGLAPISKMAIAATLLLVDQDTHPTTNEIQATLEAGIARGWLREDFLIEGNNGDWAVGFEECIEVICYAFGIKPWHWDLYEGDNVGEFQYHILY